MKDKLIIKKKKYDELVYRDPQGQRPWVSKSVTDSRNTKQTSADRLGGRKALEEEGEPDHVGP
jgi:hypothetical protein